jgi:type VI secretion system secreted protein VgrG
MAFLNREKFRFVSQALALETFAVVDFDGLEGFSKPYEFEITLVADDPEIDLASVLEQPAQFSIVRQEGDIPFHGIVVRFDQLHAVNDYVFYRALLVPRLWWLNLTRHNQVFLDKAVPDIISEVLKDGDLDTSDFELRLQNDYPVWEYVCQYRETHLAFVSRWMEREGMYYFFEQTDSGEKMIITDTASAHTEMPQGKTMYYSTPTGLDEIYREEVIKDFVCSQNLLPKTLRLKDYNYRKPSLEIGGEATVDDRGRGEIYLYGHHFRTPDEGRALARVRAEEYKSGQQRFSGESTVPFLRTGYLFDLEDHYRDGFNQNYLAVEARHKGNQTGYLLSGIQEGLADLEEEPFYKNRFTAIASNVQYRPPRVTPKARCYGTMNAKVDAAGSGKYAELDEQGRYKVILPFDLSGRQDGKASTWLRMAQPYAGTDHGMHFPLHKGTEVLLTFIDGDPDRPIVAAAVPNPETPSQVTAGDQTMSKITTAGDNRIHMEDKEGQERILMHSPATQTFVRIGHPNDPATEGGDESKSLEWEDDHAFYKGQSDPHFTAGPTEENPGIKLSAPLGLFEISAQAKNEAIIGEAIEFFGGAKFEVVVGNELKFILGGEELFHIPHKWSVSPLKTEMTETKAELSGTQTELSTTKQRLTTDLTTIQTQHNALDGEVNTLRGSHNDLAGDVNSIRESHNSLAGDVLVAYEEYNRLAADVDDVIEAHNELVGETVRLAGEDSEISGESMKVKGENMEIYTESTKVQGESTQVEGERTTIAGLQTLL